MGKVYIVVGICKNEQSKAIFTELGKYGVKESLASAKEELKKCLQEIKSDWEENELEIIAEEENELGFYIENEYNESYSYEILERNITK